MLPASLPKQLTQQLLFIVEVDKLKSILRKNPTLAAKRRENSAEHSWHLIVAAMALAEYSNEKIDLLQTLKLLAVHDLVEIEAGDTFLYERNNEEELFLKELHGAKKIFSFLPKEQAQAFLDLWLEFEKGTTLEARFARALDRFLPMLINFSSGGGTWREFSITPSMVLKKNASIQQGSQQLWMAAQELIEKAIENGYFSK